MDLISKKVAQYFRSKFTIGKRVFFLVFFFLVHKCKRENLLP